MHTPPTEPVTHRSGSGLGQEESTSYLVAVPCAFNGDEQRIANAIAIPKAQVAAKVTSVALFFIPSPVLTSIIAARNLEFLDSVPGFLTARFTDVDIPFGIDGQSVGVSQFADLMARTTKIRDDLAARMVENFHSFIVFVHNEDELLQFISRKAQPLGRARRSCHVTGTWLELASLLVGDGNILLEASRFVEHLKTIAARVAHIDQTIVTNRNTVWAVCERGASHSVRLILAMIQQPLAEEPSVAVEHDQAMVAAGFFSIRDINRAVARVNRNA